MNRNAAGKPRILHCHSNFAAGVDGLRCARLINAFGTKLQHTIVSAYPDEMRAADHISRNITVNYPRDFPILLGKPTPGRLFKLARALQGFDLVLTYGWGAMDVAMAHTLFSEMLGLPPLIHHEGDFDEDGAGQLKASRNWYRRIGLGKASGLVVPSERLEEIALMIWHQPLGRVKRIANGIDTSAFSGKPAHDALRGVVKREGELWLGTLAEFRPVKQLPLLVRAFAPLPERWHLVILGDGPERDAIRAEAERLEVSHRLHMPGHVSDPSKALGLFDIFALSSKSEQFPISVVEAMAAGLPIAAPAVGDIAQMVAPENRPFIVEPGNEGALSDAMFDLAEEAELRQTIGAANRARARAEFDETRMIGAYRRLYASALGHEI